jgi:hypothetical protein
MIVMEVIVFDDLTELIVEKSSKLVAVFFDNLGSLLDDLSYQSESASFLL